MNDLINTRTLELGSAGTASQLEQILSLYEGGQYLAAFEAGHALGPLHEWRTAEGRVMAGRLAFHLGAPRLGRALHWLGLREFPQNPYCQYYGAMVFQNRYGPALAWERIRNVDMAESADTRVRADWLAMKALLLSKFRDFSRAEKLLIDALELDPENAWLHVQLSEILDRQDLHEDALRAAYESLELKPWFRPGIQRAGHQLIQLQRDDEALALLSDATQHLQSGNVWRQLGLLQQVLKQFDEAWHSFREAERFWPLANADSNHKQWLAAQRSDIAYARGDYPQAIALAREVNRPFYKRLVEVLEKAVVEPPESAPRVQLAVPFIRQHQNTCAPATLTALAQYWNKAIKHEEVVKDIGCGGTLAKEERRWAEENQFYVREFRITLDSADALIRAGVPFTLTTVEPTSSHSQAIVGIDHLRGTFLIQDPSERDVGESSIDELLERYASTGPRGMAIIPVEERARIESIALPDADMYDLHYRVDCALTEHRRTDAIAAVEAMCRLQADSHLRNPQQLALQARMALAQYDGNQPARLALTKELLQQFPKDANLQLMRLSCLTDLGRSDQRHELLRSC